MDEQVYFDQGGVSVSNSRFIVSGQTYAVSAVTSVKQAVNELARGGPIFLGIVGLLICLIGNIAAIVIGLLTIAVAIAWGGQQKPEYIVVLNTSSGESQALKSDNKSYVESVVGALNQSFAGVEHLIPRDRGVFKRSIHRAWRAACAAMFALARFGESFRDTLEVTRT